MSSLRPAGYGPSAGCRPILPLSASPPTTIVSHRTFSSRLLLLLTIHDAMGLECHRACTSTRLSWKRVLLVFLVYNSCNITTYLFRWDQDNHIPIPNSTACVYLSKTRTGCVGRYLIVCSMSAYRLLKLAVLNKLRGTLFPRFSR